MSWLQAYTKKIYRNPLKMAAAFIALLGVAAAANVATPASALAASMYLTPESASVAPGQTLTVEIHVNTGGEKVNAVQADFTYPASRLQFESMKAVASGWTVYDDVSSGGSGEVNLTAGTTGEGVASSNLAVAQVTFTVLSDPGTANLDFLASSAVVSGTTNTDVLDSTTGASYTVTGDGGTLANTGSSLFIALLGGLSLAGASVAIGIVYFRRLPRGRAR